MKSFSNLFLLTAVSALALSSCQVQGAAQNTADAKPAPAQEVKAKNVILFIGDGMGISRSEERRVGKEC